MTRNTVSPPSHNISSKHICSNSGILMHRPLWALPLIPAVIATFSLFTNCVLPPQKPPTIKQGTAVKSAPQITPPTLGQVSNLPPPTQLQKSTRPNGLRVRTNKDLRLPLTGIGLIFDDGSIGDPLDKVGLTSLTFDLLRQGTTTRSAENISEAADMAGVSLSGNAGYETSSLSCSGKRDAIQTCISLMRDILSAASFPQSEIDLLKKQYMGSISQRKDAPATIAKLHLINMIYGDHHVSGVALNERGLRKISREDIVTRYHQAITPKKAVLVVTGSFDDDILGKITAAFDGEWRATNDKSSIKPISMRKKSVSSEPTQKTHASAPAKEDEAPAKWRLIDSPKLSQCFFSIGHKGVSKHYAKRDALKIANYTLGGGGFSSRLMKRIRADQGKTYGIGSGFSMSRQDGHFTISSFTQNKHIATVLKMVADEVKHYLSSPTTQLERDEAIGRMAGGYALHFETADAIAYSSVRAELDGFNDAHVLEYPTRLASQSLENIHTAARDIIKPDQLIGAIVCPVKEVGPILEAANIHYDTYSVNDPIKAD